MAHDANASVFKRIWIPFFILFFLTAIEFLVAFTIDSKGFRVPFFIFLTLVKAYYIIAYFMHLKYEYLNLIYSILVPILFIVVLIVALLYEGSFM